MRTPTGVYVDNPAWPLLQAHISYWGITTGAGSALGITVVDTGLASEPSYDGLTIKMLDGPAAGQVRAVQVHAANTVTVGVAFTDSAGAVQQITAGLRFVILSAMGGSGGPGPSPEEGLTYYGVVTAVPGANQFTIPALAGLGAGKFAGATNPYAAFVLRDAGGASAAPQGQLQQITAYTTATGVFTTGAFTAAVAVGDEVLIVHPALAAALLAPVIIASGTFDTSSATVPADSTRTEANNHFRGHLLIPTNGAMQWRATRIVQFTAAGGIFTVDPNNPFPAATGLVTYVVVRDQGEFVPAGGGPNNRTPSDVIGMKDETIPAMNVAPTDISTDTIVHHVKAILERVGATPADPDDSLLTGVGQRDATATLDDLSDVTTTDLQAKIRRVLLRMSGAGVFSATIQGAARTELDTMAEQLATYFVAAGAAMALQVNGNAARTNLEQALSDFFAAFGCDNANVFNPTIQGAAQTDLDAALAAMATYFSAAGAAWSVQINGNAARTNLEQVWEDFSAVFGADNANVFNPTIQGAGQTDLDAALAQLAIYFAAAGAAMSIQVNGGAARANLELVLEDYFAVVGCDGANVFNPTIQGAASLTIDAAFAALATYISPAGAAYSATVDPGGAARTNIEQTLEDLGQVLAGANGLTVFPAAAAPANGVSMAEVLRAVYDNLIVSREARPPSLFETWQDELGIDFTVWTTTDPATGTAWARGAVGAYLRATSVPNANESARLRSVQRWQAAPGVWGTNTAFRRYVLEFEIRLTTVANMDNALCFFGLTTGIGDDRSTNDIIGWALLADVLQSVTDSGGVETVNTGFAETLTNWNKLKIVVEAASVEFYINETLVATHAANLPDFPFYLNFYLDTEAGGAATLEVAGLKSWHEVTP